MAKIMETPTLRFYRMATNLLSNYTRLLPGVPKRLHFTDDYKVVRTVTDRDTGKPKEIESRIYWVDEEDGEPVSRTFSIMSQKLDAHLEPFRKDKLYNRYDFIITEMGAGFYKDWNVQPILRPETD